MKRLYWTALFYAVAGLAAGLFFREYTKAHNFTGESELAVLHTHLIALGMVMMLLVLALEKLFTLSVSKWFSLFYWHYNAGLLLTIAMMLVIGICQVQGHSASAMLAGIAGLGHIILTAGIGFLFVALGKRIQS